MFMPGSFLQTAHHAPNSTLSHFGAHFLEYTTAASTGSAMSMMLGHSVAPLAVPAAKRQIKRIATSLLSVRSFGAQADNEAQDASPQAPSKSKRMALKPGKHAK